MVTIDDFIKAANTSYNKCGEIISVLYDKTDNQVIIKIFNGEIDWYETVACFDWMELAGDINLPYGVTEPFNITEDLEFHFGGVFYLDDAELEQFKKLRYCPSQQNRFVAKLIKEAFTADEILYEILRMVEDGIDMVIERFTDISNVIGRCTSGLGDYVEEEELKRIKEEYGEEDGE